MIFVLQDAFLAGQHFAQHFPASIARIRGLKNEKVDVETIQKKDIIKTKFDVTEQSDAAEKAAAKMFPLSLISDSFKPNDPQAMKGIYTIFLIPNGSTVIVKI